MHIGRATIVPSICQKEQLIKESISVGAINEEKVRLNMETKAVQLLWHERIARTSCSHSRNVVRSSSYHSKSPCYYLTTWELFMVMHTCPHVP